MSPPVTAALSWPWVPPREPPVSPEFSPHTKQERQPQRRRRNSATWPPLKRGWRRSPTEFLSSCSSTDSVCSTSCLTSQNDNTAGDMGVCAGWQWLSDKWHFRLRRKQCAFLKDFAKIHLCLETASSHFRIDCEQHQSFQRLSTAETTWWNPGG